MSYIFGVGNLVFSATATTHAIGRLQNITFTLGYEQAQLRGGTDIFAVDTQHFNGSVEGSFEFGDVELSAIGKVIADSFVGGAGSGTVTVTGLSKPIDFKLVLSGVTNGFTGTITLPRITIPSLTLNFDRTSYMIPGMNFIAQATGTTVLTYQQ